MTEDEAKGSACFQATTFGGSQQIAAGPGPHCIGSACMAWRWSEAKRTEAYLEAVHAYVKAHKVTFSIASQKVWDERGPSFQKVEGYCGLAGAM